MEKKLALIVSVFLLCACACKKPGTQINKNTTPSERGGPTAMVDFKDTPTPAPETTQTEAPTSTPKDVSTEAVVQYVPVLIDREYFGTERFCAYIKKSIDKDQDGFLSGAEALAVTEIDLIDFHFEKTNPEEPEGTAIGFSYFPNLTNLGFVSPDCLEVKNHPSLTHYGLGEATTKDTYIENCPKLTSVFYNNAYGNLHVSDCEALVEFFALDATNNSLEFRNTPNLSVRCDAFSELVLDADAGISIGNVKLEPYGIGDIQKEDNSLRFTYQELFDTREVCFEGINSVTFDISEGFPVRYVDSEEIECFSYEIFDKIEDVYDESGNKGYNICITTEGDERRKESLSFYSSEYPDISRFYARPDKIEELRVLSYSPNNGAYIEVRWGFLIGYRGDDGETVLGSTGAKTQRWRINVDGTAKQEIAN